MKLNGFVGKGSGKLGSSVFAISGGEQIVREYNPRVANPNTDAQVAQRAKFKLMSQLATALAPALAFKKMRLESARNQFVAKNIGLCAYANDEATCDLSGLKLTPGLRPFSTLTVAAGQNNTITITNDSPLETDVKKVIVVAAKSNDQKKLVLIDVKVVNVNDEHVFSTMVSDAGPDSVLIFAYGWIETNSSTSVNYEPYQAEVVNEQASLNVVMTSLLNGGNFTDTTTAFFEP